MKKTLGFKFETEYASVTVEVLPEGRWYIDEIKNFIIFNEDKTDDELANMLFSQYVSAVKLTLENDVFVSYER